MSAAGNEQPNIEALEAKARELVEAVHEHIVAGDDAQAVSALIDAAEAALDALEARVDPDVPPNQLSEDDRAAFALAQRASTEFQHGNQLLGGWYRESARRRALERYEPSMPSY
jgi:hypothetical protein